MSLLDKKILLSPKNANSHESYNTFKTVYQNFPILLKFYLTPSNVFALINKDTRV